MAIDQFLKIKPILKSLRKWKNVSYIWSHLASVWVRVRCMLAPASANVHAAQLDKGRERELSNMAAVYDGRVGDKQS